MMNGQSIAVIIIVALAVTYLLWRFLQSRRPDAKPRGGCGCCSATCAAKEIGEKQQNTSCHPDQSQFFKKA